MDNWSTALARPITCPHGDPARGPVGVVPAAPAGRRQGTQDDRAVQPERPLFLRLAERQGPAGDLGRADQARHLGMAGRARRARRDARARHGAHAAARDAPVLPLAGHWRRTGEGSDRGHRDREFARQAGPDPHRPGGRRTDEDVRGAPREARGVQPQRVRRPTRRGRPAAAAGHRRAGVGAVRPGADRRRPGPGDGLRRRKGLPPTGGAVRCQDSAGDRPLSADPVAACPRPLPAAAAQPAGDLRRLVFRERIVVARAVGHVLSARHNRPVTDPADTGQEVSSKPTTATLSA